MGMAWNLFVICFSASTSASTGVFAFGQNKDSKPTGFSAPSYNFGGKSCKRMYSFYV